MNLPDHPVARRLITIPAYVAGWVVCSALAPLWIPVVFLVGAVRRRRFVALRLMIFLWVYLACQMLGLTAILLIWVTTLGRPAARQEQIFHLQTAWASLLLKWAFKLLRLSLHVEGSDQVGAGPLLIFIRHASIIDTLLPAVLVARPSGIRLRYVLKKELLVDPCLDLVGHALRSYFVDRGGETQQELEHIRRLCDDLGDQGVLLYPEGTRFTADKQASVLESLATRRPDLQDRARSLTHVLPPKLGGALTLLDAAPRTSCLLIAHRGLEGFAEVRHLLDGRVVGNKVEVRMWRIDGPELPPREGREDWLFAQWKRVDDFVREGPATDHVVVEADSPA